MFGGMAMGPLSVTFTGHSGFLLDTGSHALLFDLYRDEAGVLEGGLPHGGDGAVFISHSHNDHFNPAVIGLGIPGKTVFVADSGVRIKQTACTVHKVVPYETLDLGWGKVRTFGSTDEGCSFLVDADGWSIFHAGDLNDWYWREESTPWELEDDEARFLKELERIKGNIIDVAFFPVDQRLGRDANRGAVLFARTVGPHRLFPMHMNGVLDPSRLKEEMANEGIATELVYLHNQGERTTLEKKRKEEAMRKEDGR